MGLDSPIKRLNAKGPQDVCCCMGPREGEPVCPCKMYIWDVKKEGGKWTRQTLYGNHRKELELPIIGPKARPDQGEKK